MSNKGLLYCEACSKKAVQVEEMFKVEHAKDKNNLHVCKECLGTHVSSLYDTLFGVRKRATF
jgi:hypothetical protein